MFEDRETRVRVQWYHWLAKEAKRGLSQRHAEKESIHGCLLVMGELLKNSGEFMLARLVVLL